MGLIGAASLVHEAELHLGKSAETFEVHQDPAGASPS
jgi:hypothetical protein